MKPKPRYQQGDNIGERFLVQKALIGGMGEVYLCQDTVENVSYALKTFQSRFSNNPKLRAAFNTEVKTWISLGNHPNIVRCFQMPIFDNQPYMLLEWILSDENGRTDLRSWLVRGPIDFRRMLTLTIDICRGLIHANQIKPGIVHRDLKPENILVTQREIAMITDFGLATVVEKANLEIFDATDEPSERNSLIGIGGIVGTPPYMAPEQWLAGELDVRTDIYAIGCILFEMLTGHLPFIAANIDDLRTRHLEFPIPKLPDNIPQSSALNNLLAHCLAKQRRERITLDDLLDRLYTIYYQQFKKMPPAIMGSIDFKYYDYSNRGNAYIRLQRYEEALTEFNHAIEMESSKSFVYSNRGNAYQGLQRYEEALADYNHAIELDPIDAKAYSNRGLTFNNLQQYETALVDHNHAIQLDSFSALNFINRGYTYKNLRRYKEALIDYNRAIELEPNNAITYESRAGIHLELEQYKEALSDYSRAIELDPANGKTYFLRSLIYMKLGESENALSDCVYAVEFDPANSTAYYTLGQINAHLHRYEEALDNFSHAIELGEPDSSVYIHRAFAYHQLEDYDKALSDYSFYLKKKPDDGKIYKERGLNYHQMHRYDEALADFARAIEIDPTDVKAYINRSDTYYKQERYDNALADIDRAIQLDPTNPQVYLMIGVLHVNREELREALPYFEKAVQLGSPHGNQLTGQIREKLGMSPGSQIDPVQTGLIAFQQAASQEDIKKAVVQFPFMIDPGFIEAIEQIITQQVPKEHKLQFEQRLTWLRQIANENN